MSTNQKKSNSSNTKAQHQSVIIYQIITTLTLSKAKLEVENRKLKAELQALSDSRQKYKDCYESASIGYFLIDANGVIQDVNPFGAKILGTGQKALIHTPFSLYISQEDQVVFFIHRKKMLISKEPQTFMIRLSEKKRKMGYALLTLSLNPDSSDKKSQFRIILADKTLERESMDSLQNKNNNFNFLFSLIHEVTDLKGPQKFEAIIENLETLALLLGVDRIFFVLLNQDDHSISNTYQWYNKKYSRQFKDKSEIIFKGNPKVFNKLSKTKIIELSNASKIKASLYKNWLKSFPSNVKSIFRATIIHHDQIKGILGYDCISAEKSVQEEEIGLIKIAAQLIYYAIEQGTVDDLDEIHIYDGPIIIQDDEFQTDKPAVQLQPCTFSEAKSLVKVFPRRNNILISCPNCHEEILFKVSDLIEMGTTIKVTCTCQIESFFLVEMRKMYRKSVNLEGIYVHTSLQSDNSKSKNHWGKIFIKNISRFGIGFELETNRTLHIKDTLRITFNLDNNTRSIIKKDVQIVSIDANYIGCKFIDKDHDDVTIGFYLLGEA